MDLFTALRRSLTVTPPRGDLAAHRQKSDRKDAAGDIMDAASEIWASGETLMSYPLEHARQGAIRAAKAVIERMEALGELS